MFQILFCDNSGIVRVVYFLKTFFNILRIVLPIGLIFMVTLDIYKNMINGIDEKETILQKSGNRILACLIVFFTPTIINIIMSFISTIGFNTSDYTTDFATCYQEADLNLVKKLEEQEKLILDDEKEKERQEAIVTKANYLAKQEAIKEKEQEKVEQEKNNNNNYNNNLTDTNKQNNVYITNGTFYIPNIDSGKNCPKNPLNEGYNNEYGYNNYFWNMLQELKKAAIEAGYNIRYSTQGCRSYDTQVHYSIKYSSTPGRAATAGKSKHGFGIASDVMGFYKNSTEECGSNRTYSNCPGMKWAHDNAYKFGLNFPLLNANYKEDWHIEPAKQTRY